MQCLGAVLCGEAGRGVQVRCLFPPFSSCLLFKNRGSECMHPQEKASMGGHLAVRLHVAIIVLHYADG